MKLVDSKEKLLGGPEIIAQSIYSMDNLPYPKEAILASIAAETTLPNTDIVQIGNTVFVSHVGKGKNSKKMVGRAFNVDTGRNFVKNGFKYFTYLQKRGITHYTTEFDGPVFLNGFKIFKRRAKQQDTQIGIGMDPETNQYVVYMRLGKEPLARGL